jgi:hypothetical protein
VEGNEREGDEKEEPKSSKGKSLSVVSSTQSSDDLILMDSIRFHWDKVCGFCCVSEQKSHFDSARSTSD